MSRMLSLLGCDLPKTLMVGNETNPTGHWESTVVRALNDDILSSGGSKWQDWLAFNSNWYKTPKPREFQARALEVLAKEFGSSSLFVFKDPRVCRIFPFWRDVFAAAGIEPKIVLTVRHPQEVAASLERRKDNGIPALVGLLLWLRYMLDAEADTRGMTRAVASYDMLLQDPVGLAETLQARLGLFWPSLSDRKPM
ncbi:sulfotransferase family protein [Gemmobacter lanyuensis]